MTHATGLRFTPAINAAGARWCPKCRSWLDAFAGFEWWADRDEDENPRSDIFCTDCTDAEPEVR